MRRVIVFVLSLQSLWLYSQNKPEIDLESFAERLFQVQDQDLDYESIYESLLIYYTNPINLNKTAFEELSSLYILSPAQINHFFDHLKKNGALISIYELQNIEGFDMTTIRSLLPFVTVSEKADSRKLGQRIKEEENNYLLLRQSGTLEKQAGYSNSFENGYLGSPGTSYLRYRIQRFHDFSFGFTAEKDPGERYLDSKTRRPEFLSGHASLENQGVFEKVVVGDYQLQMGQGLVFGAGFSTGKGAETVNAVKRSSTGLKTYASALESGFFRGIASTLSMGNLKITTFYSHLKQDASLISDSTYSDFDEFANSIHVTGLHRTSAENETKNTIRENSFGGALEYRFTARTKIGFTGLHTLYSSPLQKKPNNYNQFEFEGTQNTVGSIYATTSWQNLIFFGEAAQSSSGGLGAVAGWLGSLGSMVDMSMVARSYDRNFHSFYGNGFSEGSRLINENGIYWGLKIHPFRQHEVALYYDHFTFPWLRYQAEAPSGGYEYLARYTYRPSRTITFYTQFRQETKQLSVLREGSNSSQLATAQKQNIIFNMDYKLGDLSLKSRVQGSNYQLDGVKTRGIALAQDLNYDYERFKFSSRIALFDTDDFSNAQYMNEREVLYAFSVPALNNTGIRSYLMVQYDASKKLSFWVRWARTSYQDQEAVGSGLTEIARNKKSDYRVMMRIRL